MAKPLLATGAVVILMYGAVTASASQATQVDPPAVLPPVCPPAQSTAPVRRFAFGSAEIAPQLFEERWNSLPQEEPITHEGLSNQDLALHLYGDWQYIRKTRHPTENYLYTGEARSSWALTLSDPGYYMDLSGTGKVMLRTRNNGWRFTHIVIKSADGRYFVSEEGSGESSSWRDVEYILSDLHWRSLMMTDTPTNRSNQRHPDPNRTPVVATSVATPDLHWVEEVGFGDLMPGGWIPSADRINSWIVYGRKVPRSCRPPVAES